MVARTRRYCVDGHMYDVDPFKPCCPKAGLGGYNRGKTHCPQGHEYTAQNTRWYKNRRHCRTCARNRNNSSRPRARDRGRIRDFLRFRDKGLCRYCGEPGSTIDHVVPRGNSGTDDVFDNMVWCCATCNNVKGMEAGFSMRSGRLYWYNRLVEAGHVFGETLLKEIRAQREERQLASGLTAVVEYKRGKRIASGGVS